jgi:hypothetical protein
MAEPPEHGAQAANYRRKSFLVCNAAFRLAKREKTTMSLFNILYSAGIVCTLFVLGAFLAWDEYRGRHIHH